MPKAVLVLTTGSPALIVDLRSPASTNGPCRPLKCFVKYLGGPALIVTFFSAASFVAQSSPTTMTGNEIGEHWCWISVCSTGTSGSPVALPAWSTQLVIGSMLFMNSAVVPTMAKSSWHARTSALRASSALSFESMKSTWTLRPPARPPLALTNLANALTPSTDPWNSPGRAALSTSAITAMRIVSAASRRLLLLRPGGRRRREQRPHEHERANQHDPPSTVHGAPHC